MANKHTHAAIPSTRTTRVRDRAKDSDYRSALDSAIKRAKEDREFRAQVRAREG